MRIKPLASRTHPPVCPAKSFVTLNTFISVTIQERAVESDGSPETNSIQGGNFLRNPLIQNPYLVLMGITPQSLHLESFTLMLEVCFLIPNPL